MRNHGTSGCWADPAALGLTLALAGCGTDTRSDTPPARVSVLADVTQEEWLRLAERRVFFGHQSVGANLLEGVTEILAEYPEIPLRVVESADPAAMTAPGLFHAKVGKNRHPELKLEAFKAIVREGLGDSGVAALKYCFIDVNGETDPDDWFDSYRRAVDSLRAARPGLVIVHVTLPLWVDRGTWFHVKTVLLGNTTDRQLNHVRQRYNELLRQTYGGREPVFDVAALESLRPDGREAAVRYRGKRVPVLAPEWTSDGGHLNAAGRRRMAEAFLVTLAKLPLR